MYVDPLRKRIYDFLDKIGVPKSDVFVEIESCTYGGQCFNDLAVSFTTNDSLASFEERFQSREITITTSIRVAGSGLKYINARTPPQKNIPDGFKIYSSPIKRGTNLHYTYKGIKPGHYEIQIFNSVGQLVYQREIIIQVNFIDDNFILPGKLGTGVYSLHIVNPEFRDKKIFMIW